MWSWRERRRRCRRPCSRTFAQQGLIASGDAHPLDAHPDGCVPAEGRRLRRRRGGDARPRARRDRARPHRRRHPAPSTRSPSPSTPATRRRPVARCRRCWARPGYLQNQVDHVASCADGRANRDASDAVGLTRTFGRHVYYASVTAPAGALGQTLAAGGPLALAYALEAMRRQQVAPCRRLPRAARALRPERRPRNARRASRLRAREQPRAWRLERERAPPALAAWRFLPPCPRPTGSMRSVEISWLGRTCFRLRGREGAVLTDPVAPFDRLQPRPHHRRDRHAQPQPGSRDQQPRRRPGRPARVQGARASTRCAASS